MNASLDLHQVNPSIFNIAGAVVLAGAITFTLFVIMQKLIAYDGEGLIEPPTLPTIVLTHEFKDKPTIEKPRLIPLPEPITRPETKPNVPEPTPDNKDLFASYIPNIQLQTPGGPLSTQLGITDGQAIPVVRMEPKYPMVAARDGIEGWVKLVFSIDILGQVQDIQVVDAQPSRTFEREAKRALAKWKYKPQIIDGVPQAQQGLEVVLDFKLNQ